MFMFASDDCKWNSKFSKMHGILINVWHNFCDYEMAENLFSHSPWTNLASFFFGWQTDLFLEILGQKYHQSLVVFVRQNKKKNLPEIVFRCDKCLDWSTMWVYGIKDYGFKYLQPHRCRHRSTISLHNPQLKLSRNKIKENKSLMESNVWSIKTLRIQYILLFISDMQAVSIFHSILSVSFMDFY